MKQVRFLRGLPGSGKSTYAKNLLKVAPEFGRTNRDDLRKLVFGGKWSNYNEKIIIEIEKSIGKILLEHGRHIVVDNSGFGSQETIWREHAKSLGAEFQLLDLGESLEECLKRDAARSNGVGQNVIRKMALRNGLIKFDKPIVICDIDGTLSVDKQGRTRYLECEPKKWTKYFEELHLDEPVYVVFKWMHELSKAGYEIVILSGRSGKYLEPTLEWFENVWKENPLFPELDIPRFPLNHVFLRDEGDKRPDTEVKLQILNYLPKDQVFLVVDDRLSVCRMWAEQGLKVITVRAEDRDFE